MHDELLERFARHDRLALSRLLSLVAQGSVATEILARLPAPSKPTRVVAFTGSGGVGKSSLVGKMIDVVRAQKLSVAVLACDPQSSLTGGALLGDRFRMGSKMDDGVFIRSLAAASGHGAVADHLDLMCRILTSFGFDVIFLETVGAGQGDIAVRAFADVVVLLLQPEAGDDLQWEKAGVLEIADLIVVHKADLPGAEETLAQVKSTLVHSPQHDLPVVAVSSKLGRGLAELWQAIASLPPGRSVETTSARDLLQLAQDTLSERFWNRQEDLAGILDDLRKGKLTPAEGANAALQILAQQHQKK